MKLPDGWRKIRLIDCGKWVGGSTPSKKESQYWNGSIPWASSQDIKSRLLQKTTYSLTEDGLRSSSNLIPANSLLMVTRSGILRHTFPVTKTLFAVAINQDIKALIPDKDFNVDYIQAVLLAENFDILKRCSKVGTTVESIEFDVLKSYSIVVPALPEQRRIAEFLGTWDEAIEKLERLIAAKEKQQKALSNHIFGQVKKQEFQQCRLVNICTIHKGVQLGKLEMNAEGRYPVLNGGISYSGYTDSYNCDANTIAISEGGNSCGFVNLIREKFWCGGHCYTLKNIRISMQYLFFFLKHRQDMLMNLRVGSGLPNIQKKDLENVEVVFPIMEEEQNRFSEILLCTQNELDLLRKKLAALQKQKRGLMQKLLTGTWRVS